jgi:hypothetical protein
MLISYLVKHLFNIIFICAGARCYKRVRFPLVEVIGLFS